MRVFIDTSVFINIAFKESGFKTLNELRELSAKKKITIFMPQVTQDEVRRVLPVRFAGLLKGIDTDYEKVEERVNQLSQCEPKYKEKLEQILKSIVKDREKKKKDLEKTKNEFEKLLPNLIGQSVSVEETSELMTRAQHRKAKGNPPGKQKDPIGDELVWEMILANFFDDEIVVVTSDGDWSDPGIVNELQIHPLLLAEWKARSKKDISIFDALADFVNAQKPDEKISEESVKEEKEPFPYGSYAAPSVGYPYTYEGTLLTGIGTHSTGGLITGTSSQWGVTRRCIRCGKDLTPLLQVISADQQICDDCWFGRYGSGGSAGRIGPAIS